jgi:hypothetical protein
MAPTSRSFCLYTGSSWVNFMISSSAWSTSSICHYHHPFQDNLIDSLMPGQSTRRRIRRAPPFATTDGKKKGFSFVAKT